MKRLAILSIPLIIWLTACGAPAATSVPEPNSVQRVTLETPGVTAAETPSPLPTTTLAPSPTLTPTFGPTATETLLPPLDLPTLEAGEPILEVWDGLPTGLAESQPGYYFRMKYKSRLWGLSKDAYGQPALGHREIEYCILAPAGVRGMPPGMQVEHDTRKIGPLYFEINVVLLGGVRQFVAYQATDTIIFTSFQVNFVDEIDACLTDAEEVLATLTSVHASLATPIP